MGAVVEPSGVEEEGEGSLGLGVVVEEVLGEDFLDGVGLLGVEAPVGHGAPAASDVEESGHGDLPHLGVRHFLAGQSLVTNSMVFCWRFTTEDHLEKVCASFFLQTHTLWCLERDMCLSFRT